MHLQLFHASLPPVMNTLTLNQLIEGNSWIGLGVAGNQPGHLGQAGEADDFKDIAALENAPKGLFPWYLSSGEGFLTTNPLSSDTINLAQQTHLQPEPEMCLVVKFNYNQSPNNANALIQGLSVIGYTAFNDCSRRVPESKLSKKKNWGRNTQGMAKLILPIDDFDSLESSVMRYRISSFLERDGTYHTYGKDTAVSEYCYFNSTLTDWVVQQINTQVDQGPLENLSSMLDEAQPEFGLIAIGATSYADFGNSDQRFLQAGDKVTVVLYDSSKHHAEDIKELTKDGRKSDPSLIILKQTVNQD